MQSALFALGVACGCVEQRPVTRSPVNPGPPKPAIAESAGGFGEAAILAVDKKTLHASGASLRMLGELTSSAYRYFRLFGPQTAARTCFALRDVRWYLPVVAVHGDAHVEQFTVTNETYGLEDYDHAGFGPAAVDLVRYAASLHLACREVSWPCRPDDLVDVYFRAYRASLERAPERSVPRVVERLRRKTSREASAWIVWAESLMRPLPASEEKECRAGWSRFALQQTEVRPDRPPAFYDVMRMGGLEMGVGSALEKKVLLRVRGPTDAPSDDLILESRTPGSPTDRACVWRPKHGTSLYTLMFMALLGPRMPEVYGFMRFEDVAKPELWVQSWDPGYRELSISDIENQPEFEELAVDAARQLAGHFWTKFPEALRAHQRNAQLAAFDLVEKRARALAKELAAEVVVSWERFRKAE